MDSSLFFNVALAVIATYAMHSTLLLLSALLLDRLWVGKLPSVSERLWKWAVLAPLLTTTVQVTWMDSETLWEIQLHADTAVVAVDSNLADVLSTKQKSQTVSAETATEKSSVEDTQTPAVEINSKPAIASSTSDAELLAEARLTETVTSTREPWVMEIVLGENLVNESFKPQSTDSRTRAEPRPPYVALDQKSIHRPHHKALRETVEQNDAKPSLAVRSGVIFVACCFMIGLLRLSQQALRIRAYLKTCSLVTEGAAASSLRRLCEQRAIRKTIYLLSSNQAAEPSACGLFRWILVLPAGLESRLPPDELNALLAHEVAHLVRRDTVWLWIGRILQMCIPWQPLNRVAVNRWQRAAELQCDEWATASAVERMTLAKALTNVAQWKTTGSLNPGLSASAPPLTQRIERLLTSEYPKDRWQHGWRRRILQFATIGVFSGLCVFGPRLMWNAAGDVVPAPLTPLPGAPTTSALPSPVLTEYTTALQQDLEALTADLELATTLLWEQEPDAQIHAKANDMIAHLRRLKSDAKRAGHQETTNSATHHNVSFLSIDDQAKSVVFLVDISSSMMHNKHLWRAKQALKTCLRQLDTSQRFQVLLFNNFVQPLNLKRTKVAADGFYVATTRNTHLAVAAIQAVTASGSTNGLPALEDAIQLAPDAIFLVTDGAANLSSKRLEKLNTLRTGAPRLHVLEFGESDQQASVDRELVDLAQSFSGQYRFFAAE